MSLQDIVQRSRRQTPFACVAASCEATRPRRLSPPAFPFDSVNAYVIGDVLVDAGVRCSTRRLRRLLSGHPTRAHALPHAHADHQGASHTLCETLDVPLWCGAADAPAMETGRIVEQYTDPTHWISRFQRRFWAGPAHPVDRPLRAGDTVAGFEVLETPGHLAFYRESDGVLILGDVLLNMNLLTAREGLREPSALFTQTRSKTGALRNRWAPCTPT